jgi:hypothetical protein
MMSPSLHARPATSIRIFYAEMIINNFCLYAGGLNIGLGGNSHVDDAEP